MIGAIRSEWVKFRSVRANLILICIAVAAPVVLTVLIAGLAPFGGLMMGEEVFSTTVIAPSMVAVYLCGVLGVLGIGQEYRHNTIRVTFAAQPRRSTVLGAKTIVYGTFGLVTGALTSGLCLLLAAAIVNGRDRVFATVWADMLGLLILFVLVTWFGFGLGSIMRQPAGAIPVFLLWPLLIEGIAGLILDSVQSGYSKWLPFRAGQRIVLSQGDFSDSLPRIAAGAYFAAWTVAIVATGWWLVKRRDA